MRDAKQDPAVAVRRTAETEAAALTGLMRRTFEDAYGNSLREADLRAHTDANFNLARQRAELGDPRVLSLLALIDDHPAGYAQMLPGPAPACVGFERPVQLLRFYLLKAHWGTGAADQLMRSCLAELSRAGHTGVWLSCWEKNRRAHGFYRRWGFGRIGTEPFVVGSDRQMDYIFARPV